MSVIVVTGTGTGVGKTIVTAAIAGLARSAGMRVAVVKPAQTGTADGDSDVATIGRLTGITESSLIQVGDFPDPLSPAVAARLSGRRAVQRDQVAQIVRAADHDHDLVLVEGAGGLLVQFDDRDGWTLGDLAADLDAPVLVVVGAGLGTLNHTALTLEAIANRDLACDGLVIGSWPAQPDLAQRCNVGDLAALAAGVGLVGALAAGAGDAADPADFLARIERGLAPQLGGTFDAADFTLKHTPEPKAFA